MKDIIIAVLCSSAFTTLLTWILNRADKKKEKNEKQSDADNDLKEAVMYLMYDSINNRANAYIDRGYISSTELEVLKKMHTCYHRMGGNGYLDTIMMAVDALPIRN